MTWRRAASLAVASLCVGCSLKPPKDDAGRLAYEGVPNPWIVGHVQNEDGKRLAGGRLPEGVEGVARFHDLVGGHADDPAEVVIGIETDRGLFVAALVAVGRAGSARWAPGRLQRFCRRRPR